MVKISINSEPPQRGYINVTPSRTFMYTCPQPFKTYASLLTHHLLEHCAYQRLAPAAALVLVVQTEDA